VALTVNRYVPFRSSKTIVAVDEFSVIPPTVTDQLPPIGSPFSVNVTAYCGTSVKAIFSTTGLPDTRTDPLGGCAE
jgi:hypothetical protein